MLLLNCQWLGEASTSQPLSTRAMAQTNQRAAQVFSKLSKILHFIANLKRFKNPSNSMGVWGEANLGLLERPAVIAIVTGIPTVCLTLISNRSLGLRRWELKLCHFYPLKTKNSFHLAVHQHKQVCSHPSTQKHTASTQWLFGKQATLGKKGWENFSTMFGNAWHAENPFWLPAALPGRQNCRFCW